MAYVLNGWRRLGIVLVVIWLVGVVSVTATELFTSTPVLFSYQGIPVGTSVEGNKVTLPDGKVINIRVPVDLLTGELAKPWELDWSQYPEIPRTTMVRWVRLGVATTIAPIVFWLFVELLVVSVAWIRRGFRIQRRDS